MKLKRGDPNALGILPNESGCLRLRGEADIRRQMEGGAA
jgi:hypothetical protein